MISKLSDIEAAIGGECPALILYRKRADKDGLVDLDAAHAAMRAEMGGDVGVYSPPGALYLSLKFWGAMAALDPAGASLATETALTIYLARGAELRGAVEKIFRDPSIALTPQILDPLLDWLAAHHPNPKAFALQADIAAQIPMTHAAKVDALAAPDFPDLAQATLSDVKADLEAAADVAP